VVFFIFRKDKIYKFNRAILYLKKMKSLRSSGRCYEGAIKDKITAVNLAAFLIFTE